MLIRICLKVITSMIDICNIIQYFITLVNVYVDLVEFRIRSFLSIWHAHSDFCKHLGIDSSTDLDDRYSNLFLNAYTNRHAHTEYLKMI